MKTIVINCDTSTCPNVQVLHTDSPLPKHWLCSACEDHIAEQQAEDQYQRSRNWSDRPIKRIADFDSTEPNHSQPQPVGAPRT